MDMMKRYLKKNIVCYINGGKWQADYIDKTTGKRFGLHRSCCNTKDLAYRLACDSIDYLNKEEA